MYVVSTERGMHGCAASGVMRRSTLCPPLLRRYVEDIMPARFLALGQADDAASVVFVSTAEEGVVFAIVDNGKREVCVLLQGLNQPNGIAYDKETRSLYIASVRLGRGSCRHAVLARLPCLEMAHQPGWLPPPPTSPFPMHAGRCHDPPRRCGCRSAGTLRP